MSGTVAGGGGVVGGCAWIGAPSAHRRDNVRVMHESSAAQPPQRVCPHCSTIARTADARCPFCRRPYRHRSLLPALAATFLLTVATTLGGVALMLQTFGDSLDRELDDQVDVVQRDFDRDVSRLERRIEAELDARLGPAEAP
jgi:hypothetical protein